MRRTTLGLLTRLALPCAVLLAPATGAGQPDEPPADGAGTDAVDDDAEEAPADGEAELPPVSPLFEPGAPAVPFQEVPEGLASLSAQSCNACHGTVHDQWLASGHGHAWSSPLYQQALAAAGEPAYCLRCHAPLHNQRASTVVGYDEGSLSKPRLEPNPRFDPTLRAEGVTCAACHVRDGMVLGPRTLRPDEAPHAVRHHPDLDDAAMCAACHELVWPGTEDKPLYDTYREWEGSAWADAGVRCQDCHMPLGLGEVTATRIAASPSHRVVGAGDDRTLARAVTVEVGTVPAELQRGTELTVPIRVLATGAGHHLPTGNPHSWIEVRAHVDGGEGIDASEQSWPLRRDVDLEAEHVETADTRIPSGGEATFEFSFTPGKKADAPAELVVVVELIYHRLPETLVTEYELPDDEVSHVFHRQAIRVPLR